MIKIESVKRTRSGSTLLKLNSTLLHFIWSEFLVFIRKLIIIVVLPPLHWCFHLCYYGQIFWKSPSTLMQRIERATKRAAHIIGGAGDHPQGDYPVSSICCPRPEIEYPVSSIWYPVSTNQCSVSSKHTHIQDPLSSIQYPIQIPVSSIDPLFTICYSVSAISIQHLISSIQYQ